MDKKKILNDETTLPYRSLKYPHGELVGTVRERSVEFLNGLFLLDVVPKKRLVRVRET